MLGVKTQNKVIALVMTMAMAIACSLAIAPAAFADLSTATAQMDRTIVPWNSNVTVTAMGGNNSRIYTYDPVTQNLTYTVGSGKTNTGQYVNVTMQFQSNVNLSGLTSATAKTYLQANTTIAGRSLTASDYKRDISDVVVDDANDRITFKIGFNYAWNTSTNDFYTTANYNGKLKIVANPDGNATISGAMGNADVETLIGTGVTISNNDGTLSNNNKTKTFTIASAAYNRGMVHVLILDGTSAIFSGTGTFSNGGLTVHAHTFMTQTEADFASLISTTATGLVTAAANPADPLITPPVIIPYSFSSGTDGTFTVTATATNATASDVKAYIYDCNYLNTIHGAVGDITEPEMQNN